MCLDLCCCPDTGEKVTRRGGLKWVDERVPAPLLPHSGILGNSCPHSEPCDPLWKTGPSL